MASAAFSSTSHFREAMTTLLPSRASSVAMARPIPVPPPVTTDTLPENGDGLSKLGLQNNPWPYGHAIFIKMAIQCKSRNRLRGTMLCTCVYNRILAATHGMN